MSEVRNGGNDEDSRSYLQRGWGRIASDNLSRARCAKRPEKSDDNLSQIAQMPLGD